MGLPYTVILTGGIASGKTTVSRLFAALGIVIIDSDELAREVVAPGEPALAAIVKRFGSGILDSDGALDRPRLRAIVFADSNARADLERITHPAIRQLMRTRLTAAESPYTILAIPLLAETGGRREADRVLVVDCPEELQLRRLMARDGSSEPQARAILAAQASREQRLALADDVIVNDGELAPLRDAVAELHARYLQLASAKRDASI
ncbi:MAG: dephospho-CoA kinase [Steroidobacteraceae bacterium]